jgi:hypothetical protein
MGADQSSVMKYNSSLLFNIRNHIVRDILSVYLGRHYKYKRVSIGNGPGLILSKR